MEEKTISEVFSKYRKLGYKGWQQDAQQEWKNYKQNKYDCKLAMIYSMDLVDPKIKEWAKIRINKEVRDSGIYHVDGYRIGKVGSKTAMKRFRR